MFWWNVSTCCWQVLAADRTTLHGGIYSRGTALLRGYPRHVAKYNSRCKIRGDHPFILCSGEIELIDRWNIFWWGSLQNYDIPKDTWVLLHFWAMSNNTVQWKDAQEFKPERFLNNDGTFFKDENLLAFSTGTLVFFLTLISNFQFIRILGRRQCPGEALARTELFLFAVGILQKFKVVLPANEKVDIHGGHFGITYTPPHHQLQFIPL